MAIKIDFTSLDELEGFVEGRYANVVLKNGKSFNNVYVEVVDEFDEGAGIVMNVNGKMIDAVAPEIKSLEVLD